jgi:type III restriction enzyme
MGLRADFPTDAYAVLHPDIRWYPGEEQQGELYTADGYARLLPPLVYKVRQGVHAWRESGYEGASETTRALLNHWFKTEHVLPQTGGGGGGRTVMVPFRYYFAQREAVESAIWLYEIEGARDPYALLKYDGSGRVSKGMFLEDWTRYVMKLATGAGKTKVLSLLIAWSYFHKRYEQERGGSDLSTNFLLVAPNIIVLDRLRQDFDGLKIFYADPILPENGYAGQNWSDDFQMTLHIQDNIGAVSETGNLFLSNIHRIYEGAPEPSIDDEDATDFFLGKRPTGKTNESKMDLSRVVREVRDLVILNDEAHHIHDESLAWFRNLRDIVGQLRLKGGTLSAQFDVTATPKHESGAIFVQTISDYPLVEAIRQRVVKTPVLPDAASRAKLQERKSEKFTERYEDYLHLGVLEWRKIGEKVAAAGKKPVLFVMTEDTKTADEVGEWLDARYQDLRGAVLVIHTKSNGEISESSSSKASEDELNRLRVASREIDHGESPYKAVASVLMLREGWDVRNVVAMVGLRGYKSKSKILPEQTLGRGLRLMFRGWSGVEGELPVEEKVSIIGTEPFIDFVESIKSEGVELDYAPMGEKTVPASPIVVEVDRENKKKDIEKLDIEIPILAPRIHREYKELGRIDPAAMPRPAGGKGLKIREFSDQEQREIVFKDIDRENVSHTTVLDTTADPSPQSAIGFFAQKLMRDLRLVGGFDVLYGQIKAYIENQLFESAVSVDDRNILRNLSEIEVTDAIMEHFKAAINALTVQDRGSTEVRGSIKLSNTRPVVVNDQPFIVPKLSVFNRVVAGTPAGGFELEFAAFLDKLEGEIVSFAKNTTLKIEYQAPDGGVSSYTPDFLVQQTAASLWVIETKGDERVKDPAKFARLLQWCEDASKLNPAVRYEALYVEQAQWEMLRPRNFADLLAGFKGKRPMGSVSI